MGKAKRNKISKRVNARSNPTGVVDDDTEVSEPSPAVILLQKVKSYMLVRNVCLFGFRFVLLTIPKDIIQS